MNLPESFDDWDSDCELDMAGHARKWRKTIKEMVIMVLMQFISNMMLLIPFFVLGKNRIFIYYILYTN